MMALRVFKQTKSTLPTGRIRRLFNYVVHAEAERGFRGQVNLIFNSDAAICKLNMQFRGIDKPTDVLSFNIEEPLERDSVFGEVYISVATAKRQAREYGNTFDEEIIRLALHGFLHLFGYDHVKKSERARMEVREAKFLKLLGIEVIR